MKESGILQRVRLALSEIGVRVFRNHVGRFRSEDGAWHSTGLVKGSSDLIGWTSVVVTPEMVGKKVAVFTAVEVKSKTGRLEPEQAIFLHAVSDAGGVAVLARSDKEAVARVREFMP